MIKKVVIPIDTADLSDIGSPLAKTIDSIGDSHTITGVGSFSLNTATPSYSYYPAGLNSVEIAPTTALSYGDAMTNTRRATPAQHHI